MRISTGPAAPELHSTKQMLHDLAERLGRLQESWTGGKAGGSGEPGDRGEARDSGEPGAGAAGKAGAERQHLALLRAKLQEQRFVLGFCGHFSAGKSTLINRLIGSPILPASPIPTTANQVLIGHGEPEAIVRLAGGEELRLNPVDLGRLSAGVGEAAAGAAMGAGLPAAGLPGAVAGRVRSVEVHYPLAHVPQSTWLMDTPGIDSTDDAHRTAAESALYLADAVFYVMDYNHVQSEVNLQFTRTLAQWGKPLYLIVNQIDKHVELEVPFAQFRQSVLSAFASWGVHPERLFFTSMTDPSHPLSQWADLLATLRELGRRRESLLLSGVYRSAVHLAEMEFRHEEEALAPERERLQAEVEAGGPSPALRAAALEESLASLAMARREAVHDLVRKADLILANAPLFPFGTKELAWQYLDARRPGFRAGFFGGGAKTRAELERRLAALHADLAAKATAHIQWHLQELLRRFGEAQVGRDEEYEEAVRGLAAPFAPELPAGLVNEAALISTEYQHKYIADITAELQLRYRKALRPLLEQADGLAARAAERKAGPQRAELAVLRRATAAADRLAEMDRAAEARQAALRAILGPEPAAARLEGGPAAEPGVGVSEPEPGARGAEPDAGGPEPGAGAVEPALVAPPALDGGPMPGAEYPAAGPGQALRHKTAKNLQEAARLLAPLPGMATTAANLGQRATRLLESQFTVALFGAFSAGKSSFANALMGINLLPASPNPTTAVITRIAPPIPGRPHGSVQVIWKSPDQLRQEVDRALHALGLSPTGDLAADLAAGAQQSYSADSLFARSHALFLAAAAQGYAAARNRLGTQSAVGLSEFQSLAASEERSCFVSEITVSIDCPVTRQGITLIDTPGADSINARHTDVAFDYIKNADAVLFVTYYNHAFSRADREFLIQLGRVKDSFALDKLFFVINAADLAANTAEMDLVTRHVAKNLQACGIRQARIFPVSSQTALWSRLRNAGRLPGPLAARLEARLAAAVGASGRFETGTSGRLAAAVEPPPASPEETDPSGALARALQAAGMAQFEAEFYRFVVTDLSQMAVDAALAEVQRAARSVADWLEAARAGADARTARLAALQEARVQAGAALAALNVGAEAGEVAREIDELLYYVKRRVLQDRFAGAFAESFNPSGLRSDSPDLKRALRESLRELTEFVAFDLGQEMRATALRVENAVNRQAERVQARAAAAVESHLPNWRPPAYTPYRSAVPAFGDGHEVLNTAPLEKLLSLFRNPDQFFQGGGRERMKDELAKGLQASVDAYLSAARAVLADRYGRAFEQQVAAIRTELAAAVADQVAGLTAALTDKGEAERLAGILERLTACDS